MKTQEQTEKELQKLAKRVGKLAEEYFLIMCETEKPHTGICFEISDFGKCIRTRKANIDTHEEQKHIVKYAIPTIVRNNRLDKIQEMIQFYYCPILGLRYIDVLPYRKGNSKYI